MSTPLNSNFLSPVNFLLSLEKLPEVTFNATSVVLPSLSMGFAIQNTPMIALPELGDQIQFGNFSIDFLINETMSNYKSIFEWITAIGHPTSLDQYNSFHQEESIRLQSRYNPRNHSSMFSDGVLEILTNNSTNGNNKVHFSDMFPISLSALPFETTVTDIIYLKARVEFKFSGFEFI
jgi:hypothetical protein